MTLQSKTIQRYRRLFPQDTLREISARTGIQITRVFRLFNGKPMKVGELEAFEKVVSEKLSANPSFSRVNHNIEQAAAILTNEEFGKIADYIERKVANRTFGRMYIREDFQNAIIA